MNKIVVKILICISILIIAFVCLVINTIEEEILEDKNVSDKVYIDGTDFTNVTEGIEVIGTLFLKFIIILYGGVALTGIWGIYGIVLLIVFIVKKVEKNKKTLDEEKVE